MKKQLLTLLSLVALTSCNATSTTLQKKVEENYTELSTKETTYIVKDFQSSGALGNYSNIYTCKHDPTHYYCEYYLLSITNKDNKLYDITRFETYVAYCNVEDKVYFYNVTRK